jgi:hypothetical protein
LGRVHVTFSHSRALDEDATLQSRYPSVRVKRGGKGRQSWGGGVNKLLRAPTVSDNKKIQRLKQGLKAIQRVLLIEISVREMRRRLQIWYLRLLVRAVASSWFKKLLLRMVLRPLTRIGLYWFLLAAILDRLPKRWEENPQIAQGMAELRATWNARATAMNARGRAIDQTLTWGTAGGGVVILTAIVTTHDHSPATCVAAICLSLSVPFLLVLGALFAFQTDENPLPLTVRDMLVRTATLWLTHFIFFAGLAAFLWSYDVRIAIVFLAGTYFAWRYFRRFAMKYHSPKQDNKIEQDP